jgi:hypothetical protein
MPRDLPLSVAEEALCRTLRLNFTPTLYPSPQGGGDINIAFHLLCFVLEIEFEK